MDDIAARRFGIPLPDWLEPAFWRARLHLSDCDHVGARTRVVGRPLIHNEGRIDVGSDCLLRSLASPIRLTATSTGTISLGSGASLEPGTRIYAQRLVQIGDHVVLGPHVTVTDTDENGIAGDILIESGVRIGAGARVIGPCRIARDTTVAAGSTVRGALVTGSVLHLGGRRASAVTQRVVSLGSASGVSSRANGASTSVAPSVSSTRASSSAAVVSAQIRRLSALLTADFTVDELSHLLSWPEYDGLAMDADVAPFDQVVPTLMGLKARTKPPDVLVVWTRPDRISPSFRGLLLGGQPAADRVLEEVDTFTSLVKSQSDGARFIFVPTWVLSPDYRGTGLLAFRDAQAANLLMRMNLRMSEAFSDTSNVFALDTQRWLAAASDGGFDPKLWYAGKVAFTSGVLTEAAKDILAAARGVFGLSRKLVVVDLDDTLWGGVVGEVGWEGLRLGGHDPNGEAFVELQRRIVALTKRGIALAVVSKNEETTALEAMRKHPEMVIRPEMLAAYRINWRDKANNIVEIAKELNLGLQSVVFLDDNPVERGRVREALPEVYVPDWPIDPTHYPGALEVLTCFDTAHISAEDVERNAMYATERERSSLRARVSTLEEWLQTLDLVVRFEPLNRSNASRVAQLLNKTNQMNLRTRRLTEAELKAWAEGAGREVWGVHVSDRFGEAGLTGILSLACTAEDVHVEDYVLSCRVMGRCVEETMLWAARRRATAYGGRRLVISPIKTAKNKPCLDFFAGSNLLKEGDAYVHPLGPDEPCPALVSVEGLP